MRKGSHHKDPSKCIRKRGDEEIKADRIKMLDMYRKGYTYRQIAEALDLTHPIVINELKKIVAEYRETYEGEKQEHIAIHLLELTDLCNIYRNAWEESKKPKEIQSTEQSSIPAPRGRAKQTYNSLNEKYKAALRKEQRDGNPAFLKGIESCLQEIAKIKGLYAPTKTELLGPDGKALTINAYLGEKTYLDVDIDNVIGKKKEES